MKTRDTNKLLMFLAVNDHCVLPENSDAVAKLPGFALAAGRFESAVEDLQDCFSLSFQLSSNASAETKALCLEALAREAAKLSGGLVTWAKIHQDFELAERVHFARSTILNAREIQAAEWVEGLVLAASKSVAAHPQALADYGVTPDLIDQVAALLDRFNQAIGRPRSIINSRKRANESIPRAIALADEELGHMDRLAPLLEAHHPDFVATYRDCRKIVHFAATRSLSETEKANAEFRAAKEDLLDAKKEAELSVILAKRDAIRAEARQVRAAFASPTNPSPAPAQSESQIPGNAAELSA